MKFSSVLTCLTNNYLFSAFYLRYYQIIIHRNIRLKVKINNWLVKWFIYPYYLTLPNRWIDVNENLTNILTCTKLYSSYYFVFSNYFELNQYESKGMSSLNDFYKSPFSYSSRAGEKTCTWIHAFIDPDVNMKVGENIFTI